MLGHELRVLGLETKFTRVDDEFVPVMDRADSVEEGDVFVSCHVNSASNANANGLSVWYHGGIAGSKRLATLILKEMLSLGTLKKYNIGVLPDTNRYTGGFGVLREASQRKAKGSALIEMGFIKNTTDRQVITNSRKRNLLAKQAALAIKEFIDE